MEIESYNASPSITNFLLREISLVQKEFHKAKLENSEPENWHNKLNVLLDLLLKNLRAKEQYYEA